MGKKQPKGWLDKYKSKVPETFGRGVAASDKAVDRVMPSDPTKLRVITQAEKDAKEAADRRNRIDVANAVQPYMWSSPKNLAVATSAIADKLRFSDSPNWFDDNFFNPAPMIGEGASALGRVPLEISEGNYGQAAFNVAAPVAFGAAETLVAPYIAKATNAGKKVINQGLRAGRTAIDQNFTQVGRQLAQIESEGLAKGLSPQEIKMQQMDQVGITSAQREGYVPGVSELLHKYVTPQGYTALSGESKLSQIVENIKKGGVKYSNEEINAGATYGPKSTSENIVPLPREDSWRMYLGMPQKHNTFEMAQTSPILHPAYTPEQLSNLELFSLKSPESKVGLLTNKDYDPYTLSSPIIDAKRSRSNVNGIFKYLDNPISTDRQHVVMGGHNTRLSKAGLEYNDVWDLEPTIALYNFLPKKLQSTFLESPLFFNTDSRGVQSLKEIKIPVDEFIGKPFMTHGVDQSVTSTGIVNSLNENINKSLIPVVEKINAYNKNNKVNLGVDEWDLPWTIKDLHSSETLLRKNLERLKEYPKFKEGGWLAKYDEGGDLDKYISKVPQTFGKNTAASESTGVNKVLPKDPRKLKLIRQAEEDAKIAKERRARINRSVSPEALDWNKPSEDLALQTSATADKLRFSDYPNWFDDSMLNPVPTLGPMVSGLGRIPLEISQGNYGQAAWNLAAPVAAGAGEAYAEMLLKPVMDPLMAYGKDVAKKYVLNPAVRKLNSILGRQASVPSMGPYMKPNHAIDDLTGTNIGRNISQDFGIDQLLANNPQLADQFKLPLYEPGSGSGLFPTTAKTSKEFRKLIYDKDLTHLYQRSKLMHGCGSAAECAKIANAITSTVNRQVTPDVPFDYTGNADNAWYSTSQMLRNNGELIYNEGRDGLINSNIASKLQVGDQVMLGPDAGTPHPSVSSATGNIKEPYVNHRSTVVGTDPDGNILLNESFDGRLISLPIQNNVYYNNNSNYGIRSIVRPSQFVDKAPDIAKRAILNDVNTNTGTMDFGVSPELQMYKELYDKVKPRLIGNLGIHADEADQIFRHVLGIGVQETKMSGKLAKGLPKAKVIIQDKLREAGLTKPVKEVMNAIKTFGNRNYQPDPDLLDFPGKSTIQMEASKLAEKEGIDIKDAVEQLYTTKYNRPKPFALSDTDPSVGTFRQKHLSKTAERLGLTEKDFKIGKGNKNSFYNNPENEILGAFANFYDLKKGLAKKHPDWDQQKLFDMATLSWNSPSKVNNDELVKYFYDFADNPKFEGFDYLNKVKNNIKTYAPLKSVTPTTEVNITKPFLQFKDGGWLEKYNDGGPVQENYNDASVSYPPNFVGEGTINGPNWKSPAWGGQFAMGGSMPGATGSIYGKSGGGYAPGDADYNAPRNINPAPDNGPGAKKTMASAEDGITLDKVYSKWPALKNMGPSAITPNTNLGKGIGYGGVEFMHPNLPEVNYDNGTLVNPTPGKNSIIYNPLTEDEQNIRLDMLHGMHQDPKFNKYREQFKQSVLGDSELNADINYWYNIDKQKGRAEDGLDQYTDNYIDGQMRTLLYEGDRKLHNYSDEEANDLHDRPDVRRSIHKMQNYLESGDQDKIYTGNRPEFLTDLHKLPLPTIKYQNGGEMRYYQDGLDWKPKSMKQGGQLTKLDQLTNFTNYNTKQPGGWLDKYQD